MEHGLVLQLNLLLNLLLVFSALGFVVGLQFHLLLATLKPSFCMSWMIQLVFLLYSFIFHSLLTSCISWNWQHLLKHFGLNGLTFQLAGLCQAWDFLTYWLGRSGWVQSVIGPNGPDFRVQSPELHALWRIQIQRDRNISSIEVLIWPCNRYTQHRTK